MNCAEFSIYFKNKKGFKADHAPSMVEGGTPICLEALFAFKGAVMGIETILSKKPELVLLFNDCKKAQELPDNEKHWRWCKKLKPRMAKLVGFFCDDKELESSDAYNKVYFHCMNLMEL